MSAVAEQVRESASSFGDVFKNRNLRRINLALSGSVIGDWAYSTAIAIWVYREGGATAVGLFGVVRYLTMAFAGPALAVYALARATACASQAFRPAQAALLPSLATNAQELTGANVVASTIESVGFFIGPAIAGLLLAIADVELVLAFDAITFVWSAALLVGLPGAPTATDGDPVGSVAVVDD